MKFKLAYIVHIVVILLAGLIYYIGFMRLNSLMRFHGFKDIYILIYEIRTSIYATTLISFSLIGVFLKNKYGWLFIAFNFYRLIFVIFFELMQESFSNWEYTISMTVFLLVIFLFLVILNIQKVSFQYYKIRRENLIGINLISMVIGGCITVLLFISKNLHYLN